jgi:hypothetical protein
MTGGLLPLREIGRGPEILSAAPRYATLLPRLSRVQKSSLQKGYQMGLTLLALFSMKAPEFRRFI